MLLSKILCARYGQLFCSFGTPKHTVGSRNIHKRVEKDVWYHLLGTPLLWYIYIYYVKEGYIILDTHKTQFLWNNRVIVLIFYQIMYMQQMQYNSKGSIAFCNKWRHKSDTLNTNLSNTLFIWYIATPSLKFAIYIQPGCKLNPLSSRPLPKIK